MTPLDEKLPEKLSRLGEIAYNLWWSWTPEARGLFRRLDYPLWRRTYHNPVRITFGAGAGFLSSASSGSPSRRPAPGLLRVTPKEPEAALLRRSRSGTLDLVGGRACSSRTSG